MWKITSLVLSCRYMLYTSHVFLPFVSIFYLLECIGHDHDLYAHVMTLARTKLTPMLLQQCAKPRKGGQTTRLKVSYPINLNTKTLINALHSTPGFLTTTLHGC